MPNPTRDQIEAPIALPKYRVEIHNGISYSTVNEDYIRNVDGVLEITANNNGLAFGVHAVPKAKIEMTDDFASVAWKLNKVRISFTFDTADFVQVFEGVLTDRSRSGHYLTFECEGWNALISRRKIYTEMFYRRPIATKTTISSIDDPEEAGYNAGLLNRIMWEAGGRPYEQIGTYTNATFYYSFDEALLRPKWSWISGEDAWEEANKLIKAAGGQLFQNANGVIYYKQPLSFGIAGDEPFEISDDDFVSISEKETARDQVATVKTQFIERNIQPTQTVYELDDVFAVIPGELVTKEIEMKWPVYTYTLDSSGNIPFNSIKAVYPDGRNITSDTELSFTYELTYTRLNATRLVITFENLTDEPLTVEAFNIQGRPVTEGSSGTATYGSGIPELELEPNVYIDSETHARRLIRMYYDFYNNSRAIITLGGMGYDPDRYIGEIIQFDYTAWAYSGLYRITALRHDSTGSRMDADIVPVNNLPIRDEMFIIGTTYDNSDVRLVSY